MAVRSARFFRIGSAFTRRLVFTALLIAAPFQAVLADERIHDYHADVQVHANGAITVTETIEVTAEGRQIRRGIYRDFPTRYRDPLGNHYRVDFIVDSVLRNGEPEPWHTEDHANGVRLYIGDANRMLRHGRHTYTLRFVTNRQLGYFDDHDELWWNVTGNGWVFPIDHASARIVLPFNLPVDELELNAWTGAFGARGGDARMGIVDARTVEFETTRGLAPRQGLSVLAAWPKGLIDEPSGMQKLHWFIRDNGAAIVLLLGLLAPLAWYYQAWDRVGRDPRGGIIIPRFKPPRGLSPAACRYVLDMAFNRNAFTAAIISLAVKGHVRIDEDGGGFLSKPDFTLTRTVPASAGADTRPTPGESAVLEALLPSAGARIEMDQENHQDFQSASTGLQAALKKEYQGRLFKLNLVHMVPPLAMSALAALIAAVFDGGPAVWIPWVLLTLALHSLFIWLLRAPTPAGRRVMDEIEGLKMYLGTAERDRLNRMSSPQLTPEVFENFLPYAYALGVENAWCERFARELPEAPEEAGYQPNWYSGRFRGVRALNHLGDDFSSSISSAIASASTAPGSSSGSGGGGFSGGGGGGGGGGGW
ncbi:DUF2207 domain-containing protein [Elongatibacter sediminis]|uniref:DUF2207 domain-containing protein n=1 Tax=Elongatibacter sediminis TaxID=3119006 RepID=A0AAW9RLE7_9GAMM